MSKQYAAIEDVTGFNVSLLKNAQVQKEEYGTRQHIVYTVAKKCCNTSH